MLAVITVGESAFCMYVDLGLRRLKGMLVCLLLLEARYDALLLSRMCEMWYIYCTGGCNIGLTLYVKQLPLLPSLHF